MTANPAEIKEDRAKPTVLVVDDEPDMRDLLEELLAADGYGVGSVEDLTTLRARLVGPQPDVVLLDMKLPDGNGIDAIPTLKQRWPDTEIIVLTCFGSIETAVEAIKRGAFHFRQKPFQTEELLMLIHRACERRQLKTRADALQRAVSTLTGGTAPLFRSAAMREILRQIERFAPSDVPILITGESGTGKEVVADLIHAMSKRASGPFVKINCAALPPHLIESELFGAVKGAFTGAHADRDGLFQQAAGGTILLDEVTEMPTETQAKLLRVLQEKTFRPVGGKESLKADCRIVSATNRRTDDAIRERKLRTDLFYRLATVTLALPPLRARREDILPMAQAFLRRFSAQAAREVSSFTPEALTALHEHSWPGNVRQLENAVQRAVLVAEGSQIDTPDLPLAHAGVEDDHSSFADLRERERVAILEALKQTRGNKAAAAAMLGITRQTLYNKIRSYGLHAVAERN